MRPSELLGRIENAYDAFRGVQKRSAYHGAVFNRLNSDWIVAPLPADHELITDLRVLRTRSRDLVRNNPLAIKYVSLVEENMVGPFGIAMQGQIKDGDGKLLKTPNRILQDKWNEFCEEVSIDGRHSMVEYCHLLAQALPADGETFTRIHRGPQYRFGLALEPIDPDLIDEQYNRTRDEYQGMNEIRLSVEVELTGRPIGYYCYEEPYFFGTSGRHRYFVPASQMIHLGRPRRMNQTRYVPWFHPVMDSMRLLDGFVEAELVASRASAAKMMWLIPDKDSAPLGEKGADGRRNSIPMEATPGSIAVGPPGYTVHGWDPQHPNTAFAEFHNGMVRRIASGLFVAYTSLANDPGDANYSSERVALLSERRYWRTTQQRFIRTFMQRVFDEFLKLAVLAGELDLGYGIDMEHARYVRWIPPGFEWVDLKNEVEAYVIAINNRLDSPQRIAAERGLDYEEDVIDQLEEAQALANEAGLPPVPGAGVPPQTDTPNAANSPESASSGGDAGTNGNGKPKNRVAAAAR